MKRVGILVLLLCVLFIMPVRAIDISNIEALGFQDIQVVDHVIYSCGFRIGEVQEDGLLIYGYSIPTTEDDVLLPVYRIPKTVENDCWAACTAMLLNYHLDLHLVSKDVVYAVQGNYDDLPGNWTQVRAGFNYYGVNGYDRGPYDMETIKRRIDTDRPFMIVVKADTGELHDVVCYGYRDTPDCQGFWIYDPENAQHSGLKLYTEERIFPITHHIGETYYTAVLEWTRSRYIGY